jgi:hypothetical protein
MSVDGLPQLLVADTGSSTTRPISRNNSTFWLVALAFVRRNSSSSRPARE